MYMYVYIYLKMQAFTYFVVVIDDYRILISFMYKVQRRKHRYNNHFSFPSLPLGWGQTGLERQLKKANQRLKHFLSSIYTRVKFFVKIDYN